MLQQITQESSSDFKGAEAQTRVHNIVKQAYQVVSSGRVGGFD